MNRKTVSLILLLLLAMPIINLLVENHIVTAETQPIYLAIIWHYHQPWYYSADESYLVLPWVRMHAVGNYFKMAYILSKYPQVKVTFTYSGSLLEQLRDIVENSKMDKREIISWKIVNGTIDKSDVFSMLQTPGGFFDINWGRIVDRSPRFSQLRSKAQTAFSTCSQVAKSEEQLVDCVVNTFTGGNIKGQEVVDLAVLFNLLWIDPLVAKELYPDIYSMMQKAYTEASPQFTTSDLRRVLETHRDIMGRIIPLYADLARRGQIELIPVPYSHPLAPILADFGFEEDVEVHVREAIRLFNETFNYLPKGIWPAEQAVNEYVVKAFGAAGIQWTVTDRDILAKSGASKTDINAIGVPWYLELDTGRVYVFFRETELSNLISFEYSKWNNTSQAVNDFVNKIISYKATAQGPRVVVVALDGENPWENYAEFGTLFLTNLYQKLTELQEQGVLYTVTPREFIAKYSTQARSLPMSTYQYLDLAGKDISNIPANSYGDGYGDLPRKSVTARLPEGSWSGGELATWIGHRQENVAWMWLVKARQDILTHLGLNSFKDLYNIRRDVALYLLKAEASDWWWWYGGDGGGSPMTFDPLFKAYLRRAYELVGLTPPDYLLVKAYPDGQSIGWMNQVTPSPIDAEPAVDGVLEDAWKQALTKGIEIPVGETLSKAMLMVTGDKLYMAFLLSRNATGQIGIYLNTPTASLSPYTPGYNVYPRYSKVDVGLYLAKEILVDLSSGSATLSEALGSGGWRKLGDVTVAIGDNGTHRIVELCVKWDDLGIPRGSFAQIAVAYYANNTLVETSTRLGLTYQLQVPMATVSGTVLYEMNDPVGDDDGPGGLGYPGNSVFKPGVFDLVKFRVVDTGSSIAFYVFFRDLGGNPWGGPNGWSLQQVHIYITTTLPAPGKNETIALNAAVAGGWHMAILLAPGWDPNPLPNGQSSAIYYYDKDKPIVQDTLFKAFADQATGAVIAVVDKSLLYDVEHAREWKYVVAVTSHDGYGTNMIRPFVIGGGEWAVNVPQQYSLAILNQVFPYIIDILAPTSRDQYTQLGSFDATAKKKAVLYPGGVPTGETTTTSPPVTTTPPIEETTSPPASPAQTGIDYYVLVVIAISIPIVMIAVFLISRKRPGKSGKTETGTTKGT